MEVSGHHTPAAVPLEKEPPPPKYPLNRRLAGATEPVWTFWGIEKYLAFARI